MDSVRFDNVDEKVQRVEGIEMSLGASEQERVSMTETVPGPIEIKQQIFWNH